MPGLPVQADFGILHRGVDWIRRRPWTTVTLVALTTLLAASSLFFPVLVARALDALTGAHPRDELGAVLVALCAIGAARGFASLARSWLLRRIRYGVTLEADDRLVRRLLFLAPEAAESVAPGDAARAVSAGERAGGFIFGEFASAVAEAGVAPALIAVLIFFDWRMAVVGIVLAIANAALLLRFVRIEERLATARAKAQARYAGVVEADLAAIDAIKTAGLDDAIAARWRRALDREHETVSRANRAGEAIAAMQSATSAIGGSIAFAVGGLLLIVDEGFGIGYFVACQALLFALNDPARRLMAIHAEALRTGAEFAGRSALETLEMAPHTTPSARAASGPRVEIEARRLTPPARFPALAPVDFSSPGKHVIGLAGGPPAAALGLSRALAGFESPASGEVLVDGLTATEVARGRVALVEGPAYLLPGTLLENITLFDPDPEFDRVRDAISRAQLGQVVETRPDGLATRVSLGRSGFSRGELTRLEIARALYRRPSALVLVGAAESLDPPLARNLFGSFAAEGLLCLVATNSPILLRSCDLVIALKS